MSADPAPATTAPAATTTAGGEKNEGGESKNYAKRAKKKGKEGAIDTEPVQGCRDFPPEEMRFRNYLFNTFHSVAKSYGFEEYDAPVLESQELYIRKQGEEITEQMYAFSTKDDHHVALRPEMTPTLARLLIAKGKALLLPVKWYSIPQCWRYEAISKGRKREHYQWNMDIIGVKSTTAEAELVCSLCTAMEKLGITGKDVGIRVNSRKILQTVVENAGVPADKFQKVCIEVDKIDKIGREAVAETLLADKIDPQVIDLVLDTLDVKSLDEIAKRIGADHPALAELKLFFDTIEAYGYKEWVEFDAKVVRGLAYYTGIVFEGFDRAGHFRAICGGGRYDNLMTKFGSPQPVPCCGFGFGDCVIMELLKEKKLLKNLPQLEKSIDYVVLPFDESMRLEATKILSKIRSLGKTATIILDKKKVPDQYKQADKALCGKYAILVAPDEFKNGKVNLKNLRKDGEGRESEDKGQNITLEELYESITSSPSSTAGTSSQH